MIDDAAPLRFRITAKEKLEADSDIMIDQTRIIDNTRITSDSLTTLEGTEVAVIEEYLRTVLGFGE